MLFTHGMHLLSASNFDAPQYPPPVLVVAVTVGGDGNDCTKAPADGGEGAGSFAVEP